MANVAILGSGPSGMIAALAVEHAGHTPTILTNNPTNDFRTYGAMYMHEPLPEIHGEPDFNIKIIKKGSRDQYARLVYGDPNAEVSWDKFDNGFMPAWDLAKTYHLLHRKFQERIYLSPVSIDNIQDIRHRFDLIVSSIPATVLCNAAECSLHGSAFKSQKVVIYSGNIPTMEGVDYNHHIVYNGEDYAGAKWYRYSQIGTRLSVEYSEALRPEVSMGGMMWWHDNKYVMLSAVNGIKPISTSCACNPDIVRIGRFGKWNKNTLTHHAYADTSDALLIL